MHLAFFQSPQHELLATLSLSKPPVTAVLWEVSQEMEDL